MSNTGQKEDVDRSISIGEKTLGYIKYNQTSADPSSYDFWYQYASAVKPELNAKIKEILANQPRLTQEQIDALYIEFFKDADNEDRIEEIGTKVSSELNDIMQMVDKSLKNTEGYSESLDIFTSELDDIKDEGSLRMIISSMAAATLEMAQNTRDLETNLERSKDQINQLNQNIEVIRTESMTDALTAIANRKKFDLTMQQETEHAINTGEPLCLLICDIDHFKSFNDTHGHQTGDQVLRLVAAILKTNVKGRDLAARYGGEEFAIILPQTDLRDAKVVAEHIRQAVMNKELIKKSTGKPLGRVTMSIGVARFRADETINEVIARADKCLYVAKDAGRNNVQVEKSEQDKQPDLIDEPLDQITDQAV